MEVVNDIVSSQMELQPGVVVQAMVLDTLSGRSPLYRLKCFLANRDVELLVGEDLPANAFNDCQCRAFTGCRFRGGPQQDRHGARRPGNPHIRTEHERSELRHDIDQPLGRLPRLQSGLAAAGFSHHMGAQQRSPARPEAVYDRVVVCRSPRADLRAHLGWKLLR